MVLIFPVLGSIAAGPALYSDPLFQGPLPSVGMNARASEDSSDLG